MLTIGDLRQKQSLPLSMKIVLSQQRVREWYDHWQGNVFVSYSGGKDSAVLLDMAREIYPDIPAVFSDTGLEFPEIRAKVKETENVIWVRPRKNFRSVIQTYGYPCIGKMQARYIRDLQHKSEKNRVTVNMRLTGYNGKGIFCPTMKLAKKYVYLADAPFRISEQCCDMIKKQPLSDYSKQSGNYPMTASMAAESRLRERNWLRNGCNLYNAKHPVSNPMSFWVEQDVLQYIHDKGLKLAACYGDLVRDQDGKWMTTGEQRTGCMFCMFGAHLESHPNRFERMKKTHPRQYEYCMKPFDEGGLGLDEVLSYLKVAH